MLPVRQRSLLSNLSCTPICAQARPYRRQHLSVLARRRSTRRATDQEPPPRDPFSRRRVGAAPPPRPPPRPKEPFDAELLILFGLPTLILIIPWAVKDPAALALIPLAFLVPGIRDVLLAVLRSTSTGVRKARVFMREDGRGRGAWAPPPRPPPPPPPGAPAAWGVYDLSEEDFEVRPAGEEQWREYEDGEGEERRAESSSSDEEAAAAVAATAAGVSDGDEEEEEEEKGVEERVLRRQRPRVAPNRVSGRVPPPLEGSDAGTAAVRLRRRPQPRPPSYDTDEYEEEIDADMAALERRRRRREARQARRRALTTVGAAGPAAAPAAPRRRRRRRNVPWYVRPLLLVFPFLRDWGGFM